jgi:DNA-binding NtrC family response regulator
MTMNSRKILLVDDETDFLEIMSKFLKRRKLSFEVAESCIKALDWISKDSFDVVVMDVKMPGLDGLDCMVEMKKIRPELEFIILTGHSSLSSGLEGIKRGAFDYCLKPVNFEEILEMILLARRKIAENS